MSCVVTIACITMIASGQRIHMILFSCYNFLKKTQYGNYLHSIYVVLGIVSTDSLKYIGELCSECVGGGRGVCFRN